MAGQTALHVLLDCHGMGMAWHGMMVVGKRRRILVDGGISGVDLVGPRSAIARLVNDSYYGHAPTMKIRGRRTWILKGRGFGVSLLNYLNCLHGIMVVVDSGTPAIGPVERGMDR